MRVSVMFQALRSREPKCQTPVYSKVQFKKLSGGTPQVIQKTLALVGKAVQRLCPSLAQQ